MFFITVKAIATNSFPSNITPSCLLLCCIVTIFSENKTHFWPNEMGNEDLIVAPKAPWSPWRRIRSWCCGIYPSEEDTGKRQMQTRDQAQHPDTQSGNGVRWEHLVLRISTYFFSHWCKYKTPQGCTLVRSAPLSQWSAEETSAANALQPGCALVHLAGSCWEFQQRNPYFRLLCLGYLGEGH